MFVGTAHGLFVGGATELFASPAIHGTTVTNTVPSFHVPAEIAAQRLTVLDVSESIARAIAAGHDAS